MQKEGKKRRGGNGDVVLKIRARNDDFYKFNRAPLLRCPGLLGSVLRALEFYASLYVSEARARVCSTVVPLISIQRRGHLDRDFAWWVCTDADWRAYFVPPRGKTGRLSFR